MNSRRVYPVGEDERQTPAAIAAAHARHYAALLAKEEPESPQWRFRLGQLSAASTLANSLQSKDKPK